MSNSISRMEDCEDGRGLGIKGVCFKSSLSNLETFFANYYMAQILLLGPWRSL